MTNPVVITRGALDSEFIDVGLDIWAVPKTSLGQFQTVTVVDPPLVLINPISFKKK